MKYALLIHHDEAAFAAAGEAAVKQMYADYGRFTQELIDAGKLGPAEELQPSSTARIVRVQDGRTLVTDGPFAELREQLGGLYIIEADSIEEAIGWAARIPTAQNGAVEVRPLAAGEYPA
ncbi:MAG: YciI family protein [Chloroflexota bacterium]